MGFADSHHPGGRSDRVPWNALQETQVIGATRFASTFSLAAAGTARFEGINLAAAVTFALYIMVIMGVGLAVRRFASKGINEFFLGGKRFGTFVVATSAVVSGRSAWLLLGLTGLAYRIGASAVWAVVGYILVELCLFATAGCRLRRLTGEQGDLTIPDFLASRSGGSGAVRSVAALVILFFMIVYVAAQVRAGGEALAGSFLPETGASLSLGSFAVHLDAISLGALITAAIILVYTVTGGYTAVAINDAIQAVVILCSLVVLPVIAVIQYPGSVMETLNALNPDMLDPFALSAGAAIGFLGIGLGSPGNPHILVRYMCARDERRLAKAAFWGTFWNVVMAWGAIWIGLAGRAWFSTIAELPGGSVEAVYPALARSRLPSVFFGLVIASIFAAILSTADSQLLVGASAVVRDLWQRLLGKDKKIDNARLVKFSRWTVLVLLISATLLGVLVHELIFSLVLFAWGGLGAGLGPPILLTLYFRRTTAAGMLAGMITGTVVTVAWKLIPACNQIVLELVPGFAASFVATLAISLITFKEPAD